MDYTPEAWDDDYLDFVDVCDEDGWTEDDCPLDGDAESALASAGFGMDEDYGGFTHDWEMDGGDLWSDG